MHDVMYVGDISRYVNVCDDSVRLGVNYASAAGFY